jgi:GH15 family glucan-1,4-alpha-glucosidase
MAMRPDRTLQPGRIGGYVDLRSYGAIGDGRTVALIALDGSIDWLPLPDLDSRPVFGRLLDAAAGGSIQLAPSEPFTVTRKYVPDTNVLQTTFTTASGVVRLTDALVTGIAGRLPWAELARRVDGIRGTVHLRWRVEPGTMLGTASPWVDDTVYGKVLRVDGVTLTVRGVDHGPRGGGGQALAGAFTTSAGSRHVLAIAGSEGEPAHMPVPELTDVGVDRTVRNWRLWSKEYHYEGPWASAVQRSALALKLLIYSPTGSIAAAATTSLPENHVGDKNWDYRFAWVRDVAYTARALVRFGLREETYASVAWLLRTIRAHDSDVAIFYALDGSLPGEVGALDAPGWKNIGEVVEGNRAKDQLQLGVYGDVLSVLRVYVAAGNVLDIETGRMLARIADALPTPGTGSIPAYGSSPSCVITRHRRWVAGRLSRKPRSSPTSDRFPATPVAGARRRPGSRNGSMRTAGLKTCRATSPTPAAPILTLPCCFMLRVDSSGASGCRRPSTQSARTWAVDR